MAKITGYISILLKDLVAAGYRQVETDFATQRPFHQSHGRGNAAPPVPLHRPRRRRIVPAPRPDHTERAGLCARRPRFDEARLCYQGTRFAISRAVPASRKSLRKWDWKLSMAKPATRQ